MKKNLPLSLALNWNIYAMTIRSEIEVSSTLWCFILVFYDFTGHSVHFEELSYSIQLMLQRYMQALFHSYDGIFTPGKVKFLSGKQYYKNKLHHLQLRFKQMQTNFLFIQVSLPLTHTTFPLVQINIPLK